MAVLHKGIIDRISDADDYEAELKKAMRNIYISKAISKYKNKSTGYREFLDIMVGKYSLEGVKKALNHLYYKTHKELKDVKTMTAHLVMRYHR